MFNLEDEADLVESKLANQLKENCDKQGKECDPLKSAPIFHQLGKIYYQRGKQECDIISIIQSAALYNAAIVRWQDQSKERQKVEDDLKELCDYILVQSEAQNQSADLIKQASKVKEQFEELRQNVKNVLQLIPQVTESVTMEELENIEKQKVTSIRDLQTYIAEYYTKIMANLAKYCQCVLGNAPCKFAIIGMGSLARKEITPYSDFEHIIALDDEIVKMFTEIEMEKVLIPYFKWLSVVFHVVVINLQETILPSVAVPSLNNFYTEEKENSNWFFDGFTTRGVSFDGLMPHACKIPIGRQISTKQKPWKTELIKPVTSMLTYLTTESQLKQGYHLGDILTRTCFVHGDRTIYNQFNEEVAKILENQSEIERIDHVKRQINADLENFATRTTLFQMYMKDKINIKSVAYRSSTLFVIAMGRLFSVQKSSCFEIIEALANMHEISDYAKHKQMYAVALACEIRLRWYMQHNSQTDVIEVRTCVENAIEKLFSIAGKPSTTSYFQIAYALQCDMSKRLNLKKLYFHSNPLLLNFSIAISLVTSTQSKMIISRTEIQKTKYDRLYDFDKCLKLLENDMSSRNTDEEKSVIAISSIGFKKLHETGDILYELSCYDDALEHFQKSLQILTDDINFSSSNLDYSLSDIETLCKTNTEKAELLSFNLKRIGECLMKTSKSNDAVKYLKQSAEIQEKASVNPSTDTKMSSILHKLGQCSLDLHEFNNALKYFNQSLQIEEQATENVEINANFANILHEIGRCLLNMNKHDEAIKYFERALQINEKITTNGETDTSLAITLHELGRCMLNINQYTEALNYFNRALQIKERATTNAQTDTSLAVTLHELGRCLLNTNQHKKALKHFENALQIEERVTTNAETDLSLAITLHILGKCLLDMNHHNKALKNLKRALQIKEQATKNAQTDTSIAVTMHELGRCLLNMNQNTEALSFLQKALKIKEQATTNPKNDLSFVRTLHELGRCLLSMKQYNEAIVYLNKALQVKERAATNAETDTSLVNTLQELGRCLVDMNRHNEALKYFEKALQIKKNQQQILNLTQA